MSRAELLRPGTPDIDEARAWFVRIIGPGDVREHQLDELLAEVV